jgi:hypothetical protein
MIKFLQTFGSNLHVLYPRGYSLYTLKDHDLKALVDVTRRAQERDAELDEGGHDEAQN